MKTNLNKVTLICVDCSRYGEAVAAINKSMEQCDFAAVKFLTDIKLEINGIEVIKILPIKSKEEYSRFIIKELYKYLDTEFCLVIQHDGYVLNGKSWQDEFLNYDYIGAPWLYSDGKNVGNGGFSLRSRLLQIFLANDEFIEATDPEDQAIGRLYRDYLIKTYGIRFAPEDLADQFAYELRTPIYDTFGFHGRFHKPFQKTVIIKRSASMGDVILVEPVLYYFYKKGYRVVLDTLDQFYMLFVNHYFPVHHPKKIDGRLLPNAEHYNLDMAYEAFPKQNRLLSYYQFCGIKDGEMVNPKLSVGFEINSATKLSPKYCIIHLEGIRQSGRNVFGVDWENVVANIQARGYTVFQVGKRNVPLIKNAIYLNTVNENFLCYAIGSADFFIGIDSGVSHIASAFNIPSILFFGNTNPEIVHPDLSNKVILTNHVSSSPICNKPYCWHEQIGVESNQCYIDPQLPPCARYTTKEVLEAVDKIIENGS
jgi:ADP-heptose:LPS heptosyltransferase